MTCFEIIQILWQLEWLKIYCFMLKETFVHNTLLNFKKRSAVRRVLQIPYVTSKFALKYTHMTHILDTSVVLKLELRTEIRD